MPITAIYSHFAGKMNSKLLLKINSSQIAFISFLHPIQAFQTSIGVLWLLPDILLSHWIAPTGSTEKPKIHYFHKICSMSQSGRNINISKRVVWSKNLGAKLLPRSQKESEALKETSTQVLLERDFGKRPWKENYEIRILRSFHPEAYDSDVQPFCRNNALKITWKLILHKSPQICF